MDFAPDDVLGFEFSNDPVTGENNAVLTVMLRDGTERRFTGDAVAKASEILQDYSPPNAQGHRASLTIVAIVESEICHDLDKRESIVSITGAMVYRIGEGLKRRENRVATKCDKSLKPL